MKILICGDSYAITDAMYPGLHWSEKISEFSSYFEVINLAFGGCSNALIALQFSMGLRLNPDFVILTFTNDGRYEYDNDIIDIPSMPSSVEIADYVKNRYTTNMYSAKNADKNKLLMPYLFNAASSNFEKLKNYFYIMYCLETLKTRNIRFCYSLGGCEYKQDYNMFLNQNFIDNNLTQYQEFKIPTNLWNYSKKRSPSFHVDDDRIQTLFANQCIKHIIGNYDRGCQ